MYFWRNLIAVSTFISTSYGFCFSNKCDYYRTTRTCSIIFPDINPTNEEGKAIIQLAERGIISGYTDGTFKPANPITRTQAAKILAGILKLDTVHVKIHNSKTSNLVMKTTEPLQH